MTIYLFLSDKLMVKLGFYTRISMLASYLDSVNKISKSVYRIQILVA